MENRHGNPLLLILLILLLLIGIAVFIFGAATYVKPRQPFVNGPSMYLRAALQADHA